MEMAIPAVTATLLAIASFSFGQLATVFVLRNFTKE